MIFDVQSLLARPAQRYRLATLAATTALASLASPASAQIAVERNAPPPVVSHGGLQQLGNDNFAGSTDDTPLGANLVGIHVLGPKEKPHGTPGIVIGDIGPMPHETMASAITPFIGQPISRKLISDVQATIARVYRQAGYPFVSVTLPPHNASRGLLQVRVVEFHAGKLKVEGAATPGEEIKLASEVRLAPGDRIQAARLEEDLDWINRNPYRTVQGVFSPGDVIGASDLSLKVSDSKPWQVFGGYSNTGQAATGYDRYYIGAGAVIAPLNDTVVSYQLTGSSDFWGDHGFDDGPNAARYQSQSMRITIPTWSRQALEISPDYIETNQAQDAFISFRNKIFELPVIYRSAISNFLPGTYLGDIYGGAEFKHLERTTYFTGVDIGQGYADVFQLVVGWADHFSDPWGHTAFDVKIKTNPGGVLDNNNDIAWSIFSSGRVVSTSYTYGLIDANRVTTLPAGFSWVSQVSALISDQALPDTEQLPLGGLYAVRGYTLDDGAVDEGFFWRNELRTPVIPFKGMPVPSDVSPYVFFDYGQGHNYNLAALSNTEMASVGGGADFHFGSYVNATLITAYALRDARDGLPVTTVGTREGAWTVQGRVLLSY
jgi:hemolysin activation/secretion protein